MDATAKPAEGEAWGILNPYGDLWTHRTFASEKAAAQYVRDFWRGISVEKIGDLRRFRPVLVNVHVSLPTPPDGQQPGGVVAQGGDG